MTNFFQKFLNEQGYQSHQRQTASCPFKSMFIISSVRKLIFQNDFFMPVLIKEMLRTQTYVTVHLCILFTCHQLIELPQPELFEAHF